jgi:restriction system protein
MPGIPDYQTLMLPVLRIAAKGETTIPKVVEALAEEFHLTAEQLAERIPNGAFSSSTTGLIGRRPPS